MFLGVIAAIPRMPDTLRKIAAKVSGRKTVLFADDDNKKLVEAKIAQLIKKGNVSKDVEEVFDKMKGMGSGLAR